MSIRVKIMFAAVGAVICGTVAGIAPARADTIVVTTANPQGWAFSNLDTSGHNASGQFVAGPSTPPLGSGSAEFTVGDGTSSEVLYSTMGAGMRLNTITTLSYSTFITSSTPGSGAAPALEFDIAYNGETTYSGRLVFDPGLLATTTQSTWQTWDAETSKAWYFSRQPGSATCQLGNGAYCTLTQVEAAFPNVTIKNVIFKVGSGQASFKGNVDALTFGTAAGTTTVNFEATVPEPASAGLLAMAVLGAGALRRRGAGQAGRTPAI